MGLLVIFLFAAVVRIALIIFGSIQDLYFAVKYTDIDYVVFSDAAKYVIDGASPYTRATYRYTPLLAFLMTPNALLHPSFGKIVFSVCDLIVGWLIVKINRQKLEKWSVIDEDARTRVYSYWPVIIWLFNPLSLAVSTRGNAESFQAVMVLATLLCIIRKYHFIGGLFFGFAIHFKIYPVIFSLPISLYIVKDLRLKLAKTWRVAGIFRALDHSFVELLLFLFASGFVLLSTTYLFYYW